MSVQHLVFVRADGTVNSEPISSYPERWIVRDGIPYERGEIAWSKPEGDEPHGAMVYVQVEPRRYTCERERLVADHGRAARELAAMPALVP